MASIGKQAFGRLKNEDKRVARATDRDAPYDRLLSTKEDREQRSIEERISRNYGPRTKALMEEAAKANLKKKGR